MCRPRLELERLRIGANWALFEALNYIPLHRGDEHLQALAASGRWGIGN